MDNVTSPSGRNKSVLVVTTTTFVVATIFVVARLVSRFGILKKGTLDDWVIIVAWVRYTQLVLRVQRLVLTVCLGTCLRSFFHDRFRDE